MSVLVLQYVYVLPSEGRALLTLTHCISSMLGPRVSTLYLSENWKGFDRSYLEYAPG